MKGAVDGTVEEAVPNDVLLRTPRSVGGECASQVWLEVHVDKGKAFTLFNFSIIL
jgi:sulfur transfer protein SufE